MSLLETERTLYASTWDHDAYANYSPGEFFLPLFLNMITAAHGDPKGRTVLDAGCGSGKGALALQAAGFRVEMCDMTPNGLLPETKAIPFADVVLWREMPGVYDYVYCCDVLEHIPTPFTMLVVHHLLRSARIAVCLSIYLTEDAWGPIIGETLHKTVQSFVEWRDQLAEMGRVVEARDCGKTGLYLVEPR